MKHNSSFELPNITDHDSMSDIVQFEENVSGSVENGVDDMDFETFENEAEYVSPDEVKPETAAEIKKIRQSGKFARALCTLQSMLSQ